MLLSVQIVVTGVVLVFVAQIWVTQVVSAFVAKISVTQVLLVSAQSSFEPVNVYCLWWEECLLFYGGQSVYVLFVLWWEDGRKKLYDIII